MDQIIDGAVSDYLNQLEESKEEFIKDIEELQNQGLSTEQILGVLGALSIADYWLGDVLMRNAIENYLKATSTMLDDMVLFGKITETELLALRKLQESTILNYTQSLGDEVRLGISESIASGFKGNRLRQQVSGRVGLNAGRIEGIIGMALATYRRSINTVMFESLPDDTQFWYNGPLDDKTRPICRVMISAQPLTRDEIETQFPGALTDGGGFNCRHEWVPLQTPNSNADRDKASEQIYENQKKFTNAKTLQEYYRERNL
tara:strand:+ start:775 stop:1557 length:783 start_codon:yes stop_codon:yes gene_type:complete